MHVGGDDLPAPPRPASAVAVTGAARSPRPIERASGPNPFSHGGSRPVKISTKPIQQTAAHQLTDGPTCSETSSIEQNQAFDPFARRRLIPVTQTWMAAQIASTGAPRAAACCSPKYRTRCLVASRCA